MKKWEKLFICIRDFEFNIRIANCWSVYQYDFCRCICSYVVLDDDGWST